MQERKSSEGEKMERTLKRCKLSEVVRTGFLLFAEKKTPNKNSGYFMD